MEQLGYFQNSCVNSASAFLSVKMTLHAQLPLHDTLEKV